jgi:hypothetical protein
MNVGTVLFQMFLVGAVIVLMVCVAIEIDRQRFWNQYLKGRWVLELIDRGYLRRIL